MLKKSIKSLIFLLIFFAIERFCHQKTEGFCIQKIRSDLPFHSEWEVKPLSLDEEKKVLKILSQPFYYLASGGQSYAFISQDQKTVLKLFKQHHMRPNSWLNQIPFLKKPGMIRDQKKRLNTIFGSSKLAYDEFREETGLLYLHLNKTCHLNQRLTLFDKLGIIHEIELDATEFVLQKKAQMLYPKINELMKKKEEMCAKQLIHRLLALIMRRCQLGIADKDPATKRNFGCIDDQVIDIDIGSFFKNEFLRRRAILNKELFYETLKFRRWISRHHPQLIGYFDEEMQKLLVTF